MCTTSDSHERKQWERDTIAWAKDYPEQVAKVAGELEVILRQFNTFDILAHVSYRNLFYLADSYEEPLHDGSSAYVEYVTLLALKSGFVQENARATSPEDIEEIQALAAQAFSMEGRFRSAQFAAEKRCGRSVSGGCTKRYSTS